MWDLPGPGLEPMFPALAGGFLTTAPRGKPSMLVSIALLEEGKVDVSFKSDIICYFYFLIYSQTFYLGLLHQHL